MLLQTFQREGYSFQTFEKFVTHPLPGKVVVLRHDVDRLPWNALKIAEIENSLGVPATYYFRMLKDVYDEGIIRAIADLGHEVGYHYETMDTCRGDVDMAYNEFCRNLEALRAIVPVKTISMHGSPLSAFDNKAIWRTYDYKALGILAEPYFDMNFNEVFYLTDTGRRWDGHRYNVRDKATEEAPLTNPAFLKLRFRHTSDIIEAVESGTFPPQAMINTHPQRWTDAPVPWVIELISQNIKNQGKRILIWGRG